MYFSQFFNVFVSNCYAAAQGGESGQERVDEKVASDVMYLS